MSRPKWLAGRDLGPTALAHWKQRAPTLFKSGYLREKNADRLRAACRMLAAADMAAAEIEASGVVIGTGSGGKKQNPAVMILVRSQAEATKLLNEFEYSVIPRF